MDNLEYCKSKARVFAPSISDLAEEALDQFDPEQQVDEEYKDVNNEKYQWTCSRDLLWKTNEFHNINQNASIVNKSTKEYLQIALLSVCESNPVSL